MFTKAKQILFMTVFILLVTGCIDRYVWKADPASFRVDNNKYYSSQITPFSSLTSPGFGIDTGYNGFILNIHNHTDKILKLDWDKTYYILNGQTYGGFMFEGIVYRERNNPKPPDIIFPNGKLLKNIWPNNLVSFSGKYWHNEEFPEGENGVYLTLIADGKEINEKLTVNILRTPVKN